MSAGSVAQGVRGRGLLRRRLGRDDARRVARAPTLAAAIDLLMDTPYRRDVRPHMDLPEAQHAVSATTLWHLRVLAGWGSPLGAEPLRLVASGYEIANVSGRLVELAGAAPRAPYVLGALSTAGSTISSAGSAADVRAALRASPWRDPGSERLADVRLALQMAWARRIVDEAPSIADWAVAGAALLMARVLASGAREGLWSGVVADATRVLGPRWRDASTIDDLRGGVPPVAARALAHVHGAADLWRAEARWWSTVEVGADALCARPRPNPWTGVAMATLLGVDAWRARAALALATRGGGDLTEVLDDAA